MPLTVDTCVVIDARDYRFLLQDKHVHHRLHQRFHEAQQDLSPLHCGHGALTWGCPSIVETFSDSDVAQVGVEIGPLTDDLLA